VAVSTFLVINKRHLLKQNSRIFRIVFIILGWGPSIVVVIFTLITQSTKDDESINLDYCILEKKTNSSSDNTKNKALLNDITNDPGNDTGSQVISISTFIYQMSYLVVLYAVCVVVLHGICKLNSQGDIEIKKAIKQLIRKVAGYMVGITIFSVFAIFTNLNQLGGVYTYGVLPYFQLFFSVMDPVMAHLFVVNRKFCSDWASFYTCKKEIEITEYGERINYICDYEKEDE
jgi:hypothetical protein